MALQPAVPGAAACARVWACHVAATDRGVQQDPCRHSLRPRPLARGLALTLAELLGVQLAGSLHVGTVGVSGIAAVARADIGRAVATPALRREPAALVVLRVERVGHKPAPT